MAPTQQLRQFAQGISNDASLGFNVLDDLVRGAVIQLVVGARLWCGWILVDQVLSP